MAGTLQNEHFLLPDISLNIENFKVEENHHYFRVPLQVLILSIQLWYMSWDTFLAYTEEQVLEYQWDLCVRTKRNKGSKKQSMFSYSSGISCVISGIDFQVIFKTTTFRIIEKRESQ